MVLVSMSVLVVVVPVLLLMLLFVPLLIRVVRRGGEVFVLFSLGGGGWGCAFLFCKVLESCPYGDRAMLSGLRVFMRLLIFLV